MIKWRQSGLKGPFQSWLISKNWKAGENSEDETVANGQVVLLKKICTCRPMRAVDGEHWEYKYWINALNHPESNHLFHDNHSFVATKPWGPKTPQQRAYPFGLLWQVWQLGEARSKPIFNTFSWETMNNLPKDMFFWEEKRCFCWEERQKNTSSNHCFSSEAKNANWKNPGIQAILRGSNLTGCHPDGEPVGFF